MFLPIHEVHYLLIGKESSTTKTYWTANINNVSSLLHANRLYSGITHFNDGTIKGYYLTAFNFFNEFWYLSSGSRGADFPDTNGDGWPTSSLVFFSYWYRPSSLLEMVRSLLLRRPPWIGTSGSTSPPTVTSVVRGGRLEQNRKSVNTVTLYIDKRADNKLFSR